MSENWLYDDDNLNKALFGSLMIFQWQLEKNWQKSKEMPCKFLGFFPVSSLAWLIKKSWDRKYQVNKFYRFPRKTFLLIFSFHQQKKISWVPNCSYRYTKIIIFYIGIWFVFMYLINFISETSEKLHKLIFSSHSSYFLSIKNKIFSSKFSNIM